MNKTKIYFGGLLLAGLIGGGLSGVYLVLQPNVAMLIFLILSLLIVGLAGLGYRKMYRFERRIDDLVNRNLDSRSLEAMADPVFQKLNQMLQQQIHRAVGSSGKEAELIALQSQINPHFLYNTLDMIRGQALIDENEEIANMVEALGAFFKYSISRRGEFITIREELNSLDNYMIIQRYRFNNRFELITYLDEQDQDLLDYYMPKLILQPVVENAVFHGLEDTKQYGKVEVEFIKTQTNIIITISDNGKGIADQKLEKIQASLGRNAEAAETAEGHTNVGLVNIQKRIQLLFGKGYGLNIYSTLGLGTDVEITIPIIKERNEDE